MRFFVCAVGRSIPLNNSHIFKPITTMRNLAIHQILFVDYIMYKEHLIPYILLNTKYIRNYFCSLNQYIRPALWRNACECAFISTLADFFFFSNFGFTFPLRCGCLLVRQSRAPNTDYNCIFRRTQKNCSFSPLHTHTDGNVNKPQRKRKEIILKVFSL